MDIKNAKDSHLKIMEIVRRKNVKLVENRISRKNGNYKLGTMNELWC